MTRKCKAEENQFGGRIEDRLEGSLSGTILKTYETVTTKCEHTHTLPPTNPTPRYMPNKKQIYLFTKQHEQDCS